MGFFGRCRWRKSAIIAEIVWAGLLVASVVHFVLLDDGCQTSMSLVALFHHLSTGPLQLRTGGPEHGLQLERSKHVLEIDMTTFLTRRPWI